MCLCVCMYSIEFCNSTNLISTTRQSCITLGQNTLHPEEKGTLHFVFCNTDKHMTERHNHT